MSEEISKELNYSTVVNNHSTTIFRKISPQGNSSATLSSAGSVGPVEVILPSSCMNFGRSRLNFTLNIESNSTSNTYNWVNSNALTTISRLVLYDSATNAMLCDVNNFAQYASLTTPSGTSFSEFATKSVPMNSASLPSASTPNGFYEDIHKCNDLTNPILSGTALIAGLAGATGPNSYFSRQQCMPSALTGTNSSVYVDYSIPFSAIKHTIFALDRNVYSPSSLILQLFFSSTDTFCWKNTSGTNPATTPSSVDGATITNLCVQLAQEANLAIVNQVINKVMSGGGISIPIGYPTVSRQAISNSTNPSYQLQLSSAYGKRILALITAPFTTGAINTNCEHRRGVITNYNTFLQGVPLKYTAGYNCLTANEDWYFGNREFFKDSAVQTVGEYIWAEWSHVDAFIPNDSLWKLDQTKIDGLDVSTQSSTWSISVTQSDTTSYNWITVILGQKVVSFTSSGTMIV
jgi:hypothetical protein